VTTHEAIEVSSKWLRQLRGTVFDVLSLTRPPNTEAARNLTKVVSKLSPLVGNLIEFNTVEYLNSIPQFEGLGRWQRQDPGFPDAVFEGNITPQPGFEIKAWFPLSTEITARFKDSEVRFQDDAIYVVVLAWMPEFVIYGRPLILDVVVVSAESVARARDEHYHNPPDYLVIEPEDTTARTVNLQQTTTSGYKFQGTSEEFQKALAIVQSWGAAGRSYDPRPEYQMRLRELIEQFRYRLDTNYAKMDRIVHPGIEDFKRRVLYSDYRGRDILEWARLFASSEAGAIDEAFSTILDIRRG
jgi:hypothetical protein